MSSNRARDNRLYLYKTVFPFLMKMPTVEDLNNGKTETGAAICNLGHYIDDHDNRTADKDITEEYHCGRTGCLAGWYVMLSDRDKRFGPHERNEVSRYDNAELADHFGIGGDIEGGKLFSGLNSGVEDESGRCVTTRRALRDRKRYLRDTMEQLGDFTRLKSTKVLLRARKVFGY